MSPENSDRPAYSKNAVAARLNELHYGKPAIVVEGESDFEFWNSIRLREVEVLPAQGRKAVIEGVEYFQDKAVGVVDDDYEQLLNCTGNPIGPNLFSTKKPNDIESLLLQAWFKQGKGYISPNRDYGFRLITRRQVKSAIGLSRKIGILRLINHIEDWGLRFRDETSRIAPWLKEFVKCVEEDGEEGTKVLIGGIKKNSQNVKLGEREILDRYNQAEIEYRNVCDFTLTNGHDLSKTIDILTNGIARSKEIERWLRREVRPNVSDFELFQGIKAWSNETGIGLITLN